MINFKDFEEVTLLSVDDNEFNQELVLAVFEAYANIKILQAENGEEAIKLLENNQVELILLDLIMPVMDGFETLKYLKNDVEYKDIPVIIVTSKEEEKRETYHLGANDFIAKPYSPEELKLRVFNHLKIIQFSKLIYEIKDDKNSSEVSSENHLIQIRKAITIAVSSQKKLLEKLGNLAHENGYKEEEASKRLSNYAQLLAQLYGLSSKEIDNIYYAMSIYDIGLLRIAKEHKRNPNSEEFKKYPLLGYSILEDLDETSLIQMSKSIILYHKENWNGSGYPHGAKEKEIPLYAQIASIVDYFDELTSSRIYSPKTISSDEALDIIKRESGIKFNPSLLNLFIDNFSEFKKIKGALS